MFIIMNTVASTVEKDRIHLYLHRRYVNSPATRAKKEYHSRVSPIVRKGGRPRVIHNPAMKNANTAAEAAAVPMAAFLLAHADMTAPATESVTEAMANHMKLSHVIISLFLRTFAWTGDKEQQSTGKHHHDAGSGGMFPWLSDYLDDTVFRIPSGF